MVETAYQCIGWSTAWLDNLTFHCTICTYILDVAPLFPCIHYLRQVSGIINNKNLKIKKNGKTVISQKIIRWNILSGYEAINVLILN
jgi:hypothetical protein